MAPKTEQERIDLYKNIFVEKGEMTKILNDHGDRVAKGVVDQLNPVLTNINDEMERGRQRFDRQDEKIHDLELRNVEADTKHHRGSPTRSSAENYQIKQYHPSRQPEMITEGAIRKKTAIIIAIVVGAFAVVGAVVLGFVYLKSLFPW